MKVLIKPSFNKKIRIEIPPSKSLAHRNIICAALADGVSHISNIQYSKDIIATIDALKHLGAEFKKTDDGLIIKGNSRFIYDGEKVNCNESGSTLRFLIPVFSLCDKEVTFCGKGRLMERPQSVYEEIYNANHLQFYKYEDKLVTKGRLECNEYILKGDVSSQFVSGLLFALPLCKEDSLIHILPPFESASYVNLTIDSLKRFGVNVYFKDADTLYIPGSQHYHPGGNRIEADYSQLVFFASLGMINQPLECGTFNTNSLQGDKACIEIIQSMGGHIVMEEDHYSFEPSALKGKEIDMEDCPDLGPMLFALATQAEGRTIVHHIKRLRMKESDRVEAMERELTRLGCHMESDTDEVIVYGKQEIEGNVECDGHNDHRIVMALSILATIAKHPVIINEAQAISKSYPNFFEDLRKCGIEVEQYDE